MARPRNSRSPSPTGSQHSARRNRKDDDRRDRGRRDDPRDHRRRSRSPADVRRDAGYHDSKDNSDKYGTQRRHRDRDRNRERDRDRDRDRDRERDDYRRRDRSLDRRDDDYYHSGRRDGGGGGQRDRRRYRDRDRDRDRSPVRRRPRSREPDRDRNRRDDSNDRARGRREGTADSRPRSRGDDGRQRGPRQQLDGARAKDAEVRPILSTIRADLVANTPPQPAKSMPTQEKSEADKKAERLAKLEAWKKKHEQKQRMEIDANPSCSCLLLVVLVVFVCGSLVGVVFPSLATSGVASPTTPQTGADASPAVAYAGKFDPKAIAKKAAPRHHSPARLGSIKGHPTEKIPAPAEAAASSGQSSSARIDRRIPAYHRTASALPQGKPISGFGFHKAGAEQGIGPAKRKLDLDDEETSKRKLAKLPDIALEDANNTPYDNQDEEDDDDSDGDNFAGTEEEAAAAARAAHERREERILQQSMAMQTDEAGETATTPVTNGTAEAAPVAAPAPEAEAEPEPEAMEVDEEAVDPLDAFMAGLDDPAAGRGAGSFKKINGKKNPAPETYFSDDEDFFSKSKEDGDAGSILAMAAKRKKKDIPAIDYSKIDLQPIRKNFWIEPHELNELTEAEVTELRNDLDGIKVSGKDVPKPVQKWSHCGLTRPILDTVDRLGYEKPTPIQMQALPVIMSGRDVIGVAKTGSGKTMAFLLPMFRHIKDQEPV